jgi:glycosyltransferase involved in cell wall biosynthesis
VHADAASSQRAAPGSGPGTQPAPGARRPALLCIAQSFAPDTTPTAIRASKLLERLAAQWDVTVLTEARGSLPGQRMQVEVVRSRRPRRLFAALRRLRLNKLLELSVWPDDSIFWVLPAMLAARRLIRERAPEAIVVFMMPYSAGIVGVLLSRITGLPLILNLDDSLTCTDMHPYFPTRLHYRLARGLEDFYLRRGDAVVYVSQTNLDTVKARAPAHGREKLKLVRYGADPAEFRPGENRPDRFEIAYVGAMCWWALIGEQEPVDRLKRLYAAWTRLGRYERTVLDQRTSSPAIAGRAILDVLAEHPSWTDRVKLMIYGNPYDHSVVARALARAGVEEVVTVLDPLPHAEVAGIIAGADLLFITLPKRVDGSSGGRISAKTYEYLMTDRPILAAVPRGENRSYLADKPGVWLVEPDDRQAMKQVIAELAQAKLSGVPRVFDRERLRAQLSYDTRAEEFAAVIRAGIERRRGSS